MTGYTVRTASNSFRGPSHWRITNALVARANWPTPFLDLFVMLYCSRKQSYFSPLTSLSCMVRDMGVTSPDPIFGNARSSKSDTYASNALPKASNNWPLKSPIRAKRRRVEPAPPGNASRQPERLFSSEYVIYSDGFLMGCWVK